MSDKNHQRSPTCDCLACVTWDRDRLRNLLNTRPAINAGLDVAYQVWTGSVYESEMRAHAGVSNH